MIKVTCVLMAAVMSVTMAAVARAEEKLVRIGDPGSVLDESKLDDRFPEMIEWAKAGVEGGIPAREATAVVQTVKPGGDIQVAIDEAAATGKPGVVLLTAGVHVRERPLRMANGVIVRGAGGAAGREKTIIEYDNRKSQDVGEAVRFENVQRAGLEDLTLRHARVTAMDPKTWIGVYEPNPKVPDLPTGNYAAVDVRKSSNCWVQNCAILNSVSRPVRIHSHSRHITMRDNLVDGAFYKGANGSGYYEVIDVSHVLLFNETVRNNRHVCIDGACPYTVVTHCRLQVDLNYHFGKGMGKTLLEANRSYLHPWHWWRTISRFSQAVEERNFIWKHEAFCKGREELDGDTLCEPGLFSLRTNDRQKPWVYKIEGAEPRHGTLYAVTGKAAEDPAEEESQKLFADVKATLRAPEQLKAKLSVLVEKHPRTLAGYWAGDALMILAQAEEAAQAEATPQGKIVRQAEVMMGKGLFTPGKALAQRVLTERPDAAIEARAKKIVEALAKY